MKHLHISFSPLITPIVKIEIMVMAQTWPIDDEDDDDSDSNVIRIWPF